MCSSRKYPYLPHGRDFSNTSPPLWKFQLSFILFFNFFWSHRTPHPHPPGNSNPFCGGSMDIFWNCTMTTKKCLMDIHGSNENHCSIQVTVLTSSVLVGMLCCLGYRVHLRDDLRFFKKNSYMFQRIL